MVKVYERDDQDWAAAYGFTLSCELHQDGEADPGPLEVRSVAAWIEDMAAGNGWNIVSPSRVVGTEMLITAARSEVHRGGNVSCEVYAEVGGTLFCQGERPDMGVEAARAADATARGCQRKLRALGSADHAMDLRTLRVSVSSVFPEMRRPGWVDAGR